VPATLKPGSVGDDVTTWQALLTGAGYAVDPTGVFDAATEAATRAWQKAKGLASDGIVGGQSWAAMTGKVAVNPYYAKDADFGRSVLAGIWRDVTGQDPTLAELQITQAQAELESHYGKSTYVNKTIPEGQPGHSSGVINNWGAVQGQPGFLASDTHQDGSPYTAHYRIYATPEEGARDFLKQMTLRRPTSWALMKTGDIDAWAEQMHSQDPETKVGLYFEQAPSARAHGIEMRIAAIADKLGEPVAAKRGGPMPAGGIADATSSMTASGAAAGAGAAALGLGGLVLLAFRYFTGRWPWIV
jgi:peptidoglycan hydrolase-like protein with peptidoglycan-binding domain